MRKAEVFVNLSVKSIAKAYSYRLPTSIEAGVGWRVVVPFGGRRVEGFVVSVAETETDDHLKDIIETVDDEAWFTPCMTAAAQELAAFYLCAPAEMMRLFMPGKSGVRIEVVYEASEASEMEESELSEPDCHAIYEVVRKAGPLADRTLRSLIRTKVKGADALLEKMVLRGWIRKSYLTKRRAAERYEKEIQDLTDKTIAQLDDNLKAKEAEIKQV